MSELNCVNVLRIINASEEDIKHIYNEIKEHIENVQRNLNQSIQFETPWIPPNKLIKTLSFNYPTTSFLLEGQIKKNKAINRTIYQAGLVIDTEEVRDTELCKSKLFVPYLGEFNG